MFLEVIEVEFMGGLMTFDVVTGYGLLCAAIFLTGFFVATRNDKRLNERAAASEK